MSERTRGIPVGPTSIAPASQTSQSTGWPKWMQDAFAYEPGAKSVEKVGRVDQPTHGASKDVRILTRVSPRP
jgi:hypothetical protein